MKFLFLIMIMITAFGVLVVHAQTYRTKVVVMNDVTDSLITPVDMEVILDYINLRKEMWQSVNVSYVEITDMTNNPVRQAKIISRNSWFSNELDRKEEINGFETRVRELPTKAKEGHKGLDHSSIYLPLVNQLNALAQSSAKYKVLILQSDLMENDIVKFYADSTWSQVEKEPEKVIEQLRERQTPANYSDITIYLVFKPADRKEDQRYQAVSRLFKQLLQDAGARVVIQSTLNLKQ